MTLALCMIVKNEESNLDRLLSQCCRVFDEICITDTGSTDHTKDIAKKYGAKVSDFTWVYDFSKARNFSFQQATAPWVMWLDADDFITKENVGKILELRAELVTSTKPAYRLKYKFNASIEGYVYRIVKRCPEILWKYPTHETLIGPLHDAEVKDITVEHWGSWKPGRDMEILQKAYEGEWKDDGRIQFYYIREFMYRHEYDKAIELYKKHLHNIPWYTKLGAYYYYAEACFKTGQDLKGLDLCHTAIRQNSTFSDFYCLLGQYYYDKGNYLEAKQWYEKAMKFPYPSDTPEVFMVRENYGLESIKKLKAIEKNLLVQSL